MFKHLKNDIPASIVVFFVALPLCLGIALASDAPPLSGLIAGIVGGIVVGYLSGSKLGVSGPAAGLAAIVAVSITEIGSFEGFLLAVVIAGFIQLIFGVLRFGIIAYFFPNSVIVGMLTGIGIFIILKQIPYLFGYSASDTGDNTFVALVNMFKDIAIGPLIIGFAGLALIIVWDTVLGNKHKVFKLIQGPIVAVLVCTILKLIFDNSALELSGSHLVEIPEASGLSEYAEFLSFPDLSYLTNPAIYTIAFTIALVASLETLLSVEATDKLDPSKNITPTNRELFAQGIGNIASGLIGGLPLTQVIVRSSANIQSNAKSKLSTIIHGFLLLIAVVSIPALLNHIPKAVLAAVLILVGYKLAKPSLFKKFWNRGWTQFLPFIITVVVIVGKDLLWGIFTGLSIGIFVVLLKSFQNSMFLHRKESADKHSVKMVLAEEVTFLNKAAIQQALIDLPSDSDIEIDIRNTKHLDYDVIEILEDFVVQAKNKNISIGIKSERGFFENPKSIIELLKLEKKEEYLIID